MARRQAAGRLRHLARAHDHLWRHWACDDGADRSRRAAVSVRDQHGRCGKHRDRGRRRGIAQQPQHHRARDPQRAVRACALRLSRHVSDVPARTAPLRACGRRPRDEHLRARRAGVAVHGMARRPLFAAAGAGPEFSARERHRGTSVQRPGRLRNASRIVLRARRDLQRHDLRQPRRLSRQVGGSFPLPAAPRACSSLASTARRRLQAM